VPILGNSHSLPGLLLLVQAVRLQLHVGRQAGRQAGSASRQTHPQHVKAIIDCTAADRTLMLSQSDTCHSYLLSLYVSVLC
jgi:acyl-CoA hydrolase